MADVDSAKFRELCGRFATGVVIIVAADPDGNLAGMTANSFASVSLQPPLVSINVEHSADFHQTIAQAERFTIQILGAGQESLSRRFAATGSDRFADLATAGADPDQFRLPGTIGVIRCEKFQSFPVGDHTIVVGRVVGGEADDGRPLLYFRGGYHPLS